MLSSWAWAPLRNPPPGFLADANTRHAASAPIRRAAERLVSFVTSVTGSAGRAETGAGSVSVGQVQPGARDSLPDIGPDLHVPRRPETGNRRP